MQIDALSATLKKTGSLSAASIKWGKVDERETDYFAHGAVFFILFVINK